MMSLDQIAADVSQNWVLYASMPFVAATIGYVTKIVAIWMMFNPIRFVGLNAEVAGVRPFGWQGIIPRKAAVMASIAVDTLTRDLLKPRDLFDRLDANRIAQEIEKPLLATVDTLAREVALQFQPGLWEAIPEVVRKKIIRRVQDQAPDLIKEMMDEVRNNLDQVFDMKEMVVSNLCKDVELLNRIFLEVGHAEFRFIRNSGIYFGFLIGCVQAVTWALTHNAWVMPLFGGFTGWFSDWLALKMVFLPQRPKKYLGLITWQGLFQKRRQEVAGDYGRLIAREILTPSAIINALLQGPMSDRLFAMTQKMVQKTIDENAGLATPIVVFAVGTARYQEMKRVIADKIFAALPETLKHVEKYAGDAIDVENTLVTNMQKLNEDQFEKLIRPAFQQDEWILITVGAVLGFLVGELQVYIMLHAAG